MVSFSEARKRIFGKWKKKEQEGEARNEGGCWDYWRENGEVDGWR